MHPRLELCLPWAGLTPQGATGTLLGRENTTEHNSQSGDSTGLVEGPPWQEGQQGGLAWSSFLFRSSLEAQEEWGCL